jgi:hypothetical protein
VLTRRQPRNLAISSRSLSLTQLGDGRGLIRDAEFWPRATRCSSQFLEWRAGRVGWLASRLMSAALGDAPLKSCKGCCSKIRAGPRECQIAAMRCQPPKWVIKLLSRTELACASLAARAHRAEAAAAEAAAES